MRNKLQAFSLLLNIVVIIYCIFEGNFIGSVGWGLVLMYGIISWNEEINGR